MSTEESEKLNRPAAKRFQVPHVFTLLTGFGDGAEFNVPFGPVLYELATGEKAFKADTVVAVVFKILHEDVDLGLVPAGPRWEKLRQVIDYGISILLVDHDMGLVLNVCDYIYVLDFGRIIAQGTPDQIRTDPEVIRAYLGEQATELQEQGAREAREQEGEG